MNTLVLRATTRALLPVMAGMSLYLLARGHNAVGGGFIGGLVAGAGVALLAFAYGDEGVARVRRLGFAPLAGAGLALCIGFGLAGLVAGRAFLRGAILETQLPLIGEFKLATSIVFDIGVYLIVVGVIAAGVGELGRRTAADAERWRPDAQDAQDVAP